MVRQATLRDVAGIATIYNHYIEHTVATFELVPVSAATIAERLNKIVAEGYSGWVAEQAGDITGYAYATRFRDRAAYQHAVEISAYIAPAHIGTGLGSALYTALFKDLKARQVHAVLACLTLPNAASQALHEKFGMQQVGHFREVGRKFDRWLDVGYWQKVL